MSRIGKKPIVLPSSVKVTLTDGKLNVAGPLGTLHLKLPPFVSAEVGAKEIMVQTKSEERNAGAVHGLFRSLIQNMVTGSSTGYTKILDIVGVGYKAEVKGKNIELNLGFSHPILYPIPEGVKVTVDKQTRVTLIGADKKVIGETASHIRKLRPPEPYKGKGVRYAGEVVKKKVGKAAAAVGGGGK